MPPRGLADVSVSENHVWSLLLHKVMYSLENFGKSFESSFLYYSTEKNEGFVGFENVCSRADLRHPYVTKLFISRHVTQHMLMTSIFVPA